MKKFRFSYRKKNVWLVFPLHICHHVGKLEITNFFSKRRYNLFSRKSSILDVRLGFKSASD